jgi:hypothetical protein
LPFEKGFSQLRCEREALAKDTLGLNTPAIRSQEAAVAVQQLQKGKGVSIRSC